MDYSAMAKQFGGTTVTPAQNAGQPAVAPKQPLVAPSAGATPSAPKVDYSALAGQFGGKTVTPAPTGEKPVGFVQGAVRAIVSPFLRAGANIATLADLNNPAELAKDQSEGVSYGDYLGKFRPIGSPLDEKGQPVSFGKQVVDTLGTGVEAAANFTGAGEAVDVAKAGLKGAIIPALVRGAKVGAATGALAGGGSAAQAPDATVGSVVGNTAIGGVLGGAIGAPLEAAGPLIKAAKGSIEEAIANRSAKAAGEVDRLAGAVAQGDAKDIASVKTALQEVDLTGAKTYADATKALDEHIKAVAGGVDKALETNPYVKPTSELSFTQKVGGEEVSHNYVEDALKQLKDYYGKIGDQVGLAQVTQLEQKGLTQGLSVKEINDIARVHGKDLSGFNANGELASGLSKQAAENTRKGLKATAREQFGHPLYKEADQALSKVIKTRDLFQEMANKVQKAQQKIKQLSLPQQIGNAFEKAVNVATLGTSRGALRAAGQAMGIRGPATMSALDLEKVLQKNIGKIDELLNKGASKETVLSKLQKYVEENGAKAEPVVEKTTMSKKPAVLKKKQGGYVSLRTLMAGGGLGTLGVAGAIPNKQTVVNPGQGAQLQPPTTVAPQDRNILAATVFGELSNKGNTADEARKIINTVVNRMKETGKSAREIITAPNQYQAYGKDQFMNAVQGKLDPLSQKKMSVVQGALDDLFSGNLKDNTDGSVFYHHDKDGNLVLKPGKLKK